MKSSRAVRAPELPAGVEMDLVRGIASAPELHGVDAEVDRVLGLIGRGVRRPVLVGPSEVGKTAVAWGLAKRIADGARPGGAQAVWQVSLRSLDAAGGKDDTAGAGIARIVREAARSPQRPVVFVRDLRTMRALDAQHELVAALSQHDALFLGEASPAFAQWAAEDAELAAVVHVVAMEPCTAERALELLRERARRAATRPGGVAVDDAALERVVRYADRLMPQRRFPGKAFALFDEAAREAAARPDRRVTAASVTDRVCESLRLPRFLVDPDTAFDAAKLGRFLRDRVVGQDDAIDAVVESVALFKSGLADPSRPMGVLLLAGPPGVGKTLLARLVAEHVFGSPQRLARVSGAEHGEDFKVDHLFGQRASQSVEARRGSLARQLAGKPFAVLLLDEIEKAHSMAYKHLLRPLDEGVFVNGNDEEICLRNTLVVMTSSVGTDAYREPGLGFARGEVSAARSESVRKRVSDLFPADLLDRVDRVCVCAPLAGDDARELARRAVAAAVQRAGESARGVTVDVDDDVIASAVASVAAPGAAGGVGARAVRRAIERAVVTPIAMYLLRESPRPGARVRVALEAGVAVASSVAPPPEAVVEPTVRRARGEIRVSAAGERRGASAAAAVAGAPSRVAAVEPRAGSRSANRAPRE